MMTNLNKAPGRFLALAATVMLAGCGTTTLSQVHNGQTDVPVWPAVGKARPLVASTVHPPLDAFAKIGPGAAKLEVYRLLGHPHYREGMFGVHEWDYVFQLPNGTQGQYATCQYKALFDDQMHLSQTFWHPAGCAALVPPGNAQAKAAEPVMTETVELSADILFDFDSARLTPDAPLIIENQVIGAIKKTEGIESLRVIGYTDRLGSGGYNMRLSQLRAQAIHDYLVKRGVPADAIFTEGRGPADPVVQCNQASRAALKECLKPNRRVRVEMLGRAPVASQ